MWFASRHLLGRQARRAPATPPTSPPSPSPARPYRRAARGPQRGSRGGVRTGAASGLREDRPGLEKMLSTAVGGLVNGGKGDARGPSGPVRRRVASAPARRPRRYRGSTPPQSAGWPGRTPGGLHLARHHVRRAPVRHAVRRSAQAPARRVRQVPARRCPVTRNLAPASGRVARTACARVLLRGGIDEKTGEALSASAVAERLAWCTALVQGMARRLAAGHWNPADLGTLAEGRDAADRPLPAQAWMALRRLGWAAAPQDGVTVNDRIVRMAQELAGRTLRSACWRDGLTRAITANWPATGATVIYVEDLRSMEARGMGRTLKPVANRARPDCRTAPAHRGRARHRRRHRPPARHLQELPPLPRAAAELQGPRPAHGPRVEVGTVPRLRLAGRPRPRRLAADRRPRPHPPSQNRRQPRRRHHDGARRRRRARSPRRRSLLRFRA